ncbi:3-oxoacyl-[acyl-carrier protein] reductase [Desulfitispora alkaliphila]|uniref:3-oxoacyl-[acyl-carrier-protein] reductase n=1 Tax=Desulfitispora alkaliphila TaxID=622674 RepID=UPI003D210190
MTFNSKVAIVTGGSRGIGRAICLELARSGATVIVNYAGNEAAATEVIQKIEAGGGTAAAIKADVKNSDEVKNMIKEVTDQFGGVHILVNNAGVTRDNLMMRMKDSEWQDVIDINLSGVYNCTKSVIKLMLKQKYGRIINVTSVVGQIGNAGQANYSAAKAGVIGLTKSMARELASRQIRVNAVAPGYIDTDMTAQLSQDLKETIEGTVPLGRLGAPEDVAKAVAFLASDNANYITGQVLNVDGGMVMQ